ncbi:hypothetical protein [Nocardia sp. XZ_19_385]|uniref:hypothetical protein n=1 Tax=Nocardia sp. XZ_19_385 TaxID=2769488 RepID=UPI00189042B1|nr:hypothetical protein [Nocardia sp. XZ_19_385]
MTDQPDVTRRDDADEPETSRNELIFIAIVFAILSFTAYLDSGLGRAACAPVPASSGPEHRNLHADMVIHRPFASAG